MAVDLVGIVGARRRYGVGVSQQRISGLPLQLELWEREHAEGGVAE